MARWLLVATLLCTITLTGCGDNKSDWDDSDQEPLDILYEDYQDANPPTPQDNYLERRMQILEHRINALNPEGSELRELIQRLEISEENNRTLRKQLSEISDQLRTSRNTDFEFTSRLSKIDQKLRLHDDDLADIRRLLETRPHRGTSNDTPSRFGDNSRPTTTGGLGSSKERMRYVADQIQDMGRSTANISQLITNIRQYETEAVTVLLSALKDRRNPSTVEGCKQCLIAIGSDNAVDQILRQLTRSVNKIESSDLITILGKIGNRRAEKTLKELLQDTDDQFLKLDIAHALTRMNNEQGISSLIQFLSSNDANKRILAIQFLRDQFGTDRGYRAFNRETKRSKAIEAWDTWFDQNYGR